MAGDKIVYNTGILYVKMAITIFISLFATRIILDALGTEDYGIYVIVGGIISMLGFLNVTMATSTQRHLSYSLGKKDREEVRSVFANSKILHFLLGLILIIFFEVFGKYLLLEELTISPDKIDSAELLFHLVVGSTFFTVLTVPYDGLLNAKENMLFLSIIGIIDSVLRLSIAYSLLYIVDDKLVVFGALMLVRSLIIILFKRIYCKNKYKHELSGSIKYYYNISKIKELCSFAGWNLAGVLAFLFRNQGIAIVLNLFFNTVVIAAYGIANQVNVQLKTFSDTMIQAIQPQMIKNESSGDRERMMRLSLISSKFSFFIFSFIALPLYFQLDYILQLWLKQVPDHTVIFCKLMLILTLIQQLRAGITISSHAIGNIREYQLYSAPAQLLSLPIGYLILKLGFPAHSILIVVILMELSTLFLNMMFFQKSTQFTIRMYVRKIILSCLSSLIVVSFSIAGLDYIILSDFPPVLRFLVILAISTFGYPLTIYHLSLNHFEKVNINRLVTKLKSLIKSI